MYERADRQWERDERAQQARARGVRIRAVLETRLRAEGPLSAAELLPLLPDDVSSSEVAFQLGRMVDEGVAVGEEGGPYRLT